VLPRPCSWIYGWDPEREGVGIKEGIGWDRGKNERGKEEEMEGREGGEGEALSK